MCCRDFRPSHANLQLKLTGDSVNPVPPTESKRPTSRADERRYLPAESVDQFLCAYNKSAGDLLSKILTTNSGFVCYGKRRFIVCRLDDWVLFIGRHVINNNKLAKRAPLRVYP